MIGAHLKQTASAQQQMAVIIQHEIQCQSSAQVIQVIHNLQDQGVLTEPGKNERYCLQCAAPMAMNTQCPVCGDNQNNEQELDLDWDDTDEREAESETVLHNDMLDQSNELGDDIRAALLTNGYSVEQSDGLSRQIQTDWRQSSGIDQAAFDCLLPEPIKADHVLAELLYQLCVQKCYQERQNTELPPAELEIYFDANHRLTVALLDKWADWELSETKAEIQWGEMTISAEKWLELQGTRRRNLQLLGQFLVEQRADVFNEKRMQQAWARLQQQALAQQTAVKATGISASTISRWCNRNNGIWLRTPLGYMTLGSFFMRPAQSVKEQEDDTAMAVLRMALAVVQEEPEITAKQLQVKLNGEGVGLGLTRAGHYLREARIFRILLTNTQRLNLQQFNEYCETAFQMVQHRPMIKDEKTLQAYYQRITTLKNLGG